LPFSFILDELHYKNIIQKSGNASPGDAEILQQLTNKLHLLTQSSQRTQSKIKQLSDFDFHTKRNWLQFH